MSAITRSTTTPSGSTSPTPWSSLILLFVLFSCCKILCFSSYRSTDFDVHRNWLAITRHLPLREWYYNDVDGATVHTLDYPPTFAYFEYILANNPFTNYLLSEPRRWLDERCLSLLGDDDNAPSVACINFHRSTVIFSDIVLWWGAWIACQAMMISISMGQQQQQQQKPHETTTTWSKRTTRRNINIPSSFLLIVFHPGLFWLDHVHFQYNGMLFGIFLASLGYLMQGNNININNNNNNNERQFHTCHWKAAFLFALLLTMKHLFLTLAPFYFVYLLRRYVLQGGPTPTPKSSSLSRSSPTTTTNPKNENVQDEKEEKENDPPRLQPLQLVTLGMYTATTLLIPFVPFLKQLPQLLKRLFPFGRGLVHDYWAANVWALYSLGQKVLTMMGAGQELLAGVFPKDVPASVCAMLLVLSLLPGLYYGAWKAACRRNNDQLIIAVVYSALSAFQLGFHVHEKAILNAIIPMVLLVFSQQAPPLWQQQQQQQSHQQQGVGVLFLQMTAFGILGIFPLLFRSVEFPLKLFSYSAYMAICYHHSIVVAVEREDDDDEDAVIRQQATTTTTNNNNNNNNNKSSFPLQWELLPVVVMVVFIIIVLECVPVRLFGKLEFLPLLLTSTVCAVGLIYTWIRLLILMITMSSSTSS